VVAPAFLMWVGTLRGYGRQLREYVVNMGEMCQHHGACFLDLGGTCSYVRETIKRISRECVGECATVVAPAFLM
jgi:hypothetical protein